MNELKSDSKQNEKNHGTVIATYKTIEDDPNHYVATNSNDLPWDNEKPQIKRVEIGSEMQPTDTRLWFAHINGLEYGDFTNLNTSNVIDMHSMFLQDEISRNSAKTFELKGLNNWNTSKVKNMCGMFANCGKWASKWEIGNLSSWDTKNVTDMNSMFYDAGCNAKTFNLRGLDNWNTQNVTNMSYMFEGAGQNASMWSIGDLSKWKTNNVIDMTRMFANPCEKISNWSVGNLTKWNVDKVQKPELGMQMSTHPFFHHESYQYQPNWKFEWPKQNGRPGIQ